MKLRVGGGIVRVKKEEAEFRGGKLLHADGTDHLSDLIDLPKEAMELGHPGILFLFFSIPCHSERERGLALLCHLTLVPLEQSLSIMQPSFFPLNLYLKSPLIMETDESSKFYFSAEEYSNKHYRRQQGDP